MNLAYLTIKCHNHLYATEHLIFNFQSPPPNKKPHVEFHMAVTRSNLVGSPANFAFMRVSCKTGAQNEPVQN